MADDESVTVTLFDKVPIGAIDVDFCVPLLQAFGVGGVLYIGPELARKPEWVEAAKELRRG